jgi:hypothetical protein
MITNNTGRLKNLLPLKIQDNSYSFEIVESEYIKKIALTHSSGKQKGFNLRKGGDIYILITHSYPIKIYNNYFSEKIDADQCGRKIHKIVLREQKRTPRCSIRKSLSHPETWPLETKLMTGTAMTTRPLPICIHSWR